MSRFREIYLPLLKSMKVELFMFLYMLGMSLSMVTQGMLVQDKLCLSMGQPKYFCTNLNVLTDEEDPQNYKNKILSDAAQFSMYSTIIENVPGVFWSFFLGSWSDKYIHGHKFILCAAGFGLIVSLIIFILSAIFFETSKLHIFSEVLGFYCI